MEAEGLRSRAAVLAKFALSYWFSAKSSTAQRLPGARHMVGVVSVLSCVAFVLTAAGQGAHMVLRELIQASMLRVGKFSGALMGGMYCYQVR